MLSIGPPLTSEQILAVEKVIKEKLPPEYKEFLLQYNGGAPYPNWFKIQWEGQYWALGQEFGIIEYFLSIYADRPAEFFHYYKIFNGRIPSDTIAIGFDPGGNLILLGKGKANYGKVFFWMHSYETNEEMESDYSNVGFIANSFNEFIDSLFPEL